MPFLKWPHALKLARNEAAYRSVSRPSMFRMIAKPSHVKPDNNSAASIDSVPRQPEALWRETVMVKSVRGTFLIHRSYVLHVAALYLLSTLCSRAAAYEPQYLSTRYRLVSWINFCRGKTGPRQQHLTIQSCFRVKHTDMLERPSSKQREECLGHRSLDVKLTRKDTLACTRRPRAHSVRMVWVPFRVGYRERPMNAYRPISPFGTFDHELALLLLTTHKYTVES